MPLKSKPIGIPLETVEYKFGRIGVIFNPHKYCDDYLQDYWDWRGTFDSIQIGHIYYGLRIPAEINLQDYWDWRVTFDSIQIGHIYYGLRIPAEINENIVRQLMDHWLKY